MSFMTVLTSRTSCRIDQVKSRNQEKKPKKTTYISTFKEKLRHLVITIRVKEGRSQISDYFQLIMVQPIKPILPVSS